MFGFVLDEMQNMQKELQEKYKGKWRGLYSKKGFDILLWIIDEA